jgi:hypothetical protein
MIKRSILTLALATALVYSASAATDLTFVGNGYVILDVNNAADTYFDINNQGNDSITPSFDTDNTNVNSYSQTITIQLGQSIKLGGQLQTFPQAGGTSAFLGYRITDLNETTGSFTEMSLPFLDQIGNNDRWQQLASTSGVEIGSTLAVGSYLLEVYEHATNNNSLFNQEGAPGNDWEMRIDVVPEPSTLSLLAAPAILGAVLFMRRRRS